MDIAQRWGNPIIKEVYMTVVNPWYGVREGVIAYLRGRKRSDRGGGVYCLLMPLINIHDTGVPQHILS